MKIFTHSADLNYVHPEIHTMYIHVRTFAHMQEAAAPRGFIKLSNVEKICFLVAILAASNLFFCEFNMVKTMFAQD